MKICFYISDMCLKTPPSASLESAYGKLLKTSGQTYKTKITRPKWLQSQNYNDLSWLKLQGQK